jgi:hypothetical protein
MTTTERAILQDLVSNRDRRLSFIQERLRPAIGAAVGAEGLWSLLSQRFVFLNVDSRNTLGNWDWVPTKVGCNIVSSNDDFDPNDEEKYLKSLRTQISDLDDRIYVYASEAVRAYSASCFLASSVMLGVASERAFQLLGEAFASWLSGDDASRFREVFEKPRQNYISKFSEFRKRIEPHKSLLPVEFSDNMALTFDSVLDLLRINRNEIGHPTGRKIDSDEAYTNLQLFARYLKKLHGLRSYFAGANSNASPT